LWITSLDKSDKTTCSKSVKIRLCCNLTFADLLQVITNVFDLFTAHRLLKGSFLNYFIALYMNIRQWRCFYSKLKGLFVRIIYTAITDELNQMSWNEQ
jgi:hypothetical protein